MNENFVESLRYLVIKVLAGDFITLHALKEYLIDGESPSVLSHKYKIGKFKLRGYIQRVIEKAGNYRIAQYVIKSSYNPLCGLAPIVVKVPGGYYCTVCEKSLTTNPERHIRLDHRDIVNRIVSECTRVAKRSES
ncbi:MAG: hypothetical protein RMI56_05885 [Sulfolobales archaeon]|nr:hypothetical protein [Sulfolobales archaeon]MDW8083306.1 hypothetical protein [Sulfolobales archaeon]